MASFLFYFTEVYDVSVIAMNYQYLSKIQNAFLMVNAYSRVCKYQKVIHHANF